MSFWNRNSGNDDVSMYIDIYIYIFFFSNLTNMDMLTSQSPHKFQDTTTSFQSLRRWHQKFQSHPTLLQSKERFGVWMVEILCRSLFGYSLKDPVMSNKHPAVVYGKALGQRQSIMSVVDSNKIPKTTKSMCHQISTHIQLHTITRKSKNVIDLDKHTNTFNQNITVHVVLHNSPNNMRPSCTRFNEFRLI